MMQKCIRLAVMQIDLTDYFTTATGERSVRAIAQRAQIDPSTLNRQLKGKTSLTVETVVAICRAFGLDFAETFVSVGFITEVEARNFSAAFSLSEYTDRELTREMVRRLDRGEATSALTEPITADEIEHALEGDVRGRRDDYGLVANDSIDETRTDEGLY